LHEFEDQSHTQGPGTPEYNAPEVKRSRKYDVKADIYSLGVIVEELFNLRAGLGKRSLDSNSKTKIQELMNRMTAYVADNRPNCEEILNRNDLWDTAFDQSLKEKNIRISGKIATIRDSFHLFFIRTKLNQRSFTTQIKNYEQNFKEIEIISTGSFGTISKAVEKKSNKNFAIYKIPLNEDQKKSDEISLFHEKHLNEDQENNVSVIDTTNKLNFLLNFTNSGLKKIIMSDVFTKLIQILSVQDHVTKISTLKDSFYYASKWSHVLNP